MPNIRSLYLNCAPISLKKNYPNLERVSVPLLNDEDVQAFISFLHFNRQITFLEVKIAILDNNDLIFSSIEKANLTRLKKLRISHLRSIPNRNTMEPIPKYRFNTIDSFIYSCRGPNLDPVVYSFEFNDLKKITLEKSLYSDWMNFILNNKKLKIFKTRYFFENWLENHENAIKELLIKLTELPELEQIIVEYHGMKIHDILKAILGSGWKPIEMKMTWRNPPHSFKSRFQRIFKRN